MTIDRPYYPSVSYFEEAEEAEEYYNELIKDEGAEDGEYEVSVALSVIKNKMFIKTNY